LVTMEDRFKLQGVIRALNPDARIIETVQSKVDLSEVLHTQLFDFEAASQGAGWVKELNEEHIPETEEYGISSLVFRNEVPFHPERLMKWIEEWPSEVVRAKGCLRIATRDEIAVMLSQAGPSIGIEPAGNWDLEYGSKMTELVLIGVKLNHHAITEGLNRCLLTAKELTQDWSLFNDPLPKFFSEQYEGRELNK